MRYMIALPCMDMVHTLFLSSLMAMDRPERTELAICSSSLVYDARNTLAEKAVNEGFDRVLWLDSDMVFGPDLMNRLIADMDEGRDIVSALYFTRKAPIKPCLYKALRTLENGKSQAEHYMDYPKDAIFQVAGCGFGACMTSVAALKAAGSEDRPFSPIEGWGEDFSFELRAQEAGFTVWCDSRIKPGHIAQTIINESAWEEANT